MARGYQYLVYGRSSCPYCNDAQDLLGFCGLDYTFFDHEDDRGFLEEVKTFYGMTTVPIILKMNEETGLTKLIGGFDKLKGELSD